VKLTSHKTTVKEETVQMNTEDDRRTKAIEKHRTDVVRHGERVYLPNKPRTLV